MAQIFSSEFFCGAPAHELRRSPAAAAVGRMAAECGLFLSHFEYRISLVGPEHWLPLDRPDLGEPGSWFAGVLSENKYQSFRNDLMIGSFHPGHRAKWTAHELCHGLVGFAWRPDASSFFHALAARLSELLPVVLFYFFDEAHLRRCEDHEDGGPLFGVFCRACERVSRLGGPRDGDRRPHPNAERFIQEGFSFLKRELAAVAKSLRLGRPIASPWANLDLCSDGLAYAAAQGPRLASPQFRRYMAQFFGSHCGRHDSLEALEARILEVAGALCGETAATPWQGDSWLWACQDVGWRLLEVLSEAEGEAAAELDRLVTGLAERPDEEGLRYSLNAYAALCDDYVLPPPETLFSVGYALPGGLGFSHRQICDGVVSACPRSWELLAAEQGDRLAGLLSDFVAWDRPRREFLGRRFALWLEEMGFHRQAEVAALEAAIAHAPPADGAALSLGCSAPAHPLWRLDPSVNILETNQAVMAAVGLSDGGPDPAYLAVRRDAGGEVVILNLDERLGSALLRLRQGPLPRRRLALDEASFRVLQDNRLISPIAWSLTL